MALTRWNPVREMISLRDAMDRIMDEALGETRMGEQVAALRIDAYATDADIVVEANLPGVRPEDVEITLEGDTLTIRGEMNRQQERKEVNYLFAERFQGKFSRSLRLNVPVDSDKVAAHFENGVLTLTLPKAEVARPKVIRINAN